MTPECTRRAAELYARICDTVKVVSSPESAEMTKIVENTFRAVNIALVNEMAILGDRMGIDIWETIDAASTKPFGFMPFWPGPGLGGHCIPVDPFYLTWRAKAYDLDTEFVELAGRINANMPRYAVARIARALNEASKPVKGSRILLLGMAYKGNVSDMRESPSLKLVELLRADGAIVTYHDPHVPHVNGLDMDSVELTPEALAAADAVVIATHHRAVDMRSVVANAQPGGGPAQRGAPDAQRLAQRRRRRRTSRSSDHPAPGSSLVTRHKVWIDLTNSPHVLFFRPILRRLDEAGVPSVVTARDYAQTLGLLELYGIPHTVIGRHGGARLGGKVDRPRPAVPGADPVRARHEGHPAGGQPRLQRPRGGREAAPAAQHGAPRLRGRHHDAQDQLPAGGQGHGARRSSRGPRSPRWVWTSAGIGPTRASRSR